MDVVSNQVLASRHAEEKTTARAASKLMTTYLVFGALKEGRLSLEQSVVIPEKIAVLNSGGSRMFLQAGGKATVQELLYGLIIHDADDAALVLSLVVSGDEKRFVELMNQESLRLGMKSTLYVSPFGSGKGGYSTLADLAVLAANVIREYPAYYFNFSVRELTYNSIRMRNPNRLLWLDPAVDGLMATNGSGQSYVLVASARRNSALGERRLLSIVSGAVSDQARTQESLKLLNWGFQNFDMIRLFEKDQIVAKPEVWKGSSGNMEVGFVEDTYVSIPKGAVPRLRSVLVRNDPLIAPIDEGARIGTLKVMIENKVIAELPVFALEQINVASFLGRLWDTICLWFK
ncbi:D-alanyl-D-alanine carboxypeptidase [Oxalobacter aliiformigenes]|nr:D-alanyl-D-alanine carboxypeptidase [Oxalobacter aliiformigenes]